jgi:hypothetical protein
VQFALRPTLRARRRGDRIKWFFAALGIGTHCRPEPMRQHVRSWRKQTLHRHRNMCGRVRASPNWRPSSRRCSVRPWHWARSQPPTSRRGFYSGVKIDRIRRKATCGRCVASGKAISLVRLLNLGPTQSRSADGGNNETDDKNNNEDDWQRFFHRGL